MRKLVLGSSVRKKEWLDVQRANSSLFEKSIILGHNIDGGDLTLNQKGHIPSTCRNLVIKEFLKTDGTHLVWIDEDLVLDRENFEKMVQAVNERPKALNYGLRIFDHVIDQREEFKADTQIPTKYAFSCFTVLPRSELEKDLDEDWFPEWFSGNWGYEDLAMAYKYSNLFGSEIWGMEAVVKSVGDENKYRGYRLSSELDMLDPIKKIGQAINYRKYLHYFRVIDYLVTHGYKPGVIPRNTYLKFPG